MLNLRKYNSGKKFNTYAVISSCFSDLSTFLKCYFLEMLQSPYFASMFGGCWKETEMSTVKIDIIDENITQECKSLGLTVAGLEQSLNCLQNIFNRKHLETKICSFLNVHPPLMNYPLKVIYV